MFDSHCHLNFKSLQPNLTDNLNHCIDLGINQWMIPGTTTQSHLEFKILNQQISQLKNGQFNYALGLHPYFIDQHKLKDIQILENQIQDFDIHAIGETGLDSTCDNQSLQLNLLTRHFELAKNLNIPIILHHRNSQTEIYKIAKKFPTVNGVIHAFSGSYEQAKQWIDLGYFLGIGGTITYTRAKKTRNAIQKIDLSHLLLETDAPSMPILDQQGKTNHPQNLIQIAKSLSELKSVDINVINNQTTLNAENLFRKI